MFVGTLESIEEAEFPWTQNTPQRRECAYKNVVTMLLREKDKFPKAWKFSKDSHRVVVSKILEFVCEDGNPPCNVQSLHERFPEKNLAARTL